MSKVINVTIRLIWNWKGLHALYDEVETQLRNLDSLGLHPNHCGSMVIPVLRNKLPKKFKIIIWREFIKNAWDQNAQEKVTPQNN